jgi:preprotein translocase subunit SecE
VAKRFEKVSVSDDEPVETGGDMTEETSAAISKPDTRPAPGHRPKKAAHEAGLVERISQFLRDTRAEMRRVSWPTLVMVRNSTLITLVAVVFFAVYLFGIDRLWTFLIDNLKGLLGG